MFRSVVRLLSSSRVTPAPVDTSGDRVTLYAHLSEPRQFRRVSKAASSAPVSRPQLSHRQWLLQMRLEHTKICDARRCRKLSAQNIGTAGDLLAADVEELAKAMGAPLKAVSVLKRYQRAISLAASVPGMTPRDALLLISIHRRSTRRLALEKPGELHRDIQRFALSTKGRRLLKGRRTPGVKRVKRWIEACEGQRSIQVA